MKIFTKLLITYKIGWYNLARNKNTIAIFRKNMELLSSLTLEIDDERPINAPPIQDFYMVSL